MEDPRAKQRLLRVAPKVLVAASRPGYRRLLDLLGLRGRRLPPRRPEPVPPAPEIA